MFFNRLVITSLIASSAFSSLTVSAKNTDADDKAVRELVADLQSRITALEGEIRGNSQNNKQKRGTRGLNTERRQLKKNKKNKKAKEIKSADRTICYGDLGQLGAGHINLFSFLLGDASINQATMQFGIFSLDDDESLQMEITASSLIATRVGSELAGNRRLHDGRSYITGSGILMKPLVYICPEDSKRDIEECYNENGDDTMSKEDPIDCVRNICAFPEHLTDVEPNAFLPLSITVIDGVREDPDSEHDRELQRILVPEFDSPVASPYSGSPVAYNSGSPVASPGVGFEMDGSLDVTTNTVKFYVPSSAVGGKYVFVDLSFVAGAGGIQFDFDGDLEGLTLSSAVLGPHLIEITKPVAVDDVCDFFQSEALDLDDFDDIIDSFTPGSGP
jgi:hypothetical protein